MDTPPRSATVKATVIVVGVTPRSLAVSASNEVAYVTAAGEVRRIDRLVELTDEIWVLDYKTGEPPTEIELMAQYDAQMEAYRAAVSSIAPTKTVKAVLLFANGVHRIVGPT